MKFNIGDQIIVESGRVSYKGIIFDYKENNYYLIKWTDYVNPQQHHIAAIDNHYVIDKEYVWNKQLKELLSEVD